MKAWFEGWMRPETRDWDLRGELSNRIKCPLLVALGTADPTASLEHGREAASLSPKSELWLVPEVGHMLPQEAPEEFNAKLLEHLSQVMKRN